MKYCFYCPADFAKMRAVIRQFLDDSRPNHAGLLFVALNEAVNNAFLHGCAEFDEKGVEVEICVTDDEISLRVSHQGMGAVPAVIGRKLPEDLEDHGRGIAIIRLCTDYAEYDSTGRELIMRKIC